MDAWLSYTVNGLTAGSFYALVALGYTMVYGVIRLFNLAHGEFYMVGAFAGWSVLNWLSATNWPVALVLLLALVAAMAGTSVLGLVAARVAYQPLLRAPRLSMLISAVGLSLALQYGVQRTYGAGFESYPHFLGAQAFSIGDVRISVAQLVVFGTALGLMQALRLFLNHSTVGTAMRALAMDADGARLVGVNVERLILLTFVIGSALAAAAGFMTGLYYGQISFFMGFLVGLRAFTAAVIGGIGNVAGAMVGGLLIGLVESYAVGYTSGAWKDVVVFGVLIGVLVLRPTGIFGERVVARV
ncbi:MAG TPA: branched-chain amino acid ABC transporter permease [Sporichthya sp.]|nr:branched-chain amino acid ABC transporter permease [Sporichthya sp.]